MCRSQALAAVEAPLEKASGYLRTLQMHASTELCTHTYAFELAVRKRRTMLALQACCCPSRYAPRAWHDEPRVA